MFKILYNGSIVAPGNQHPIDDFEEAVKAGQEYMQRHGSVLSVKVVKEVAAVERESKFRVEKYE